MSEPQSLTREQCETLFSFLEETEEGKKVIEEQLAASQRRHDEKALKNGTLGKSQKLPVTKPNKELDKLKKEIFFLYMQPGSSSRRIREAMKAVPGFELLSNKKQRSFDNTLNGWGYPLYQPAHKSFVAYLKQRLQDGFNNYGNIAASNEDDIDAEHEIDDSYPLVFTKYDDRDDQTTIAPVCLNSFPISTSSEVMSIKKLSPSINALVHQQLNDFLLAYESKPIPISRKDPQKESRRATVIPPEARGKAVPMRFPDITEQSRSRSSSSSFPRYHSPYSNPSISSASFQNLVATSVVPSALFKICCDCIRNGDYASMNELFECPYCGFANLHSVGLHQQSLAPVKLEVSLFQRNDINKRDKAGNTMLHYMSTIGPTKDMLLRYQNAGLDFTITNNKQQTWLHCLHAPALGQDLLDVLKDSTSQNLFGHRDVYGETILMALLRAPLKQDLCRKLTEIFSPYSFIVQDNMGLTALSVFLNTYQRHSTLNGLNDEVLQTLKIFRDYVGTANVELAFADNDDQLQRRIQVIKGHMTFDIDRSNALQCSAYWPPGHTEEEEQQRYSNVQRSIAEKVDLHNYDNNGDTPMITHIKSVEPTRDDCTTANVIECMIKGGANFEFRDREGKTALYWACVGGLVACVDILLKSGARVNVRATPGKNVMSKEDSQRGISLLQATYMARETALNHHRQEGSMISRSLLERLCKIISCVEFNGAKMDPSMVDEWGL